MASHNPSRINKSKACGKVRYRDELSAKRAMRTIQNVGSHDPSGRVPVRWYECDGCAGFHLTSQEK